MRAHDPPGLRRDDHARRRGLGGGRRGRAGEQQRCKNQRRAQHGKGERTSTHGAPQVSAPQHDVRTVPGPVGLCARKLRGCPRNRHSRGVIQDDAWASGEAAAQVVGEQQAELRAGHRHLFPHRRQRAWGGDPSTPANSWGSGPRSWQQAAMHPPSLGPYRPSTFGTPAIPWALRGRVGVQRFLVLSKAGSNRRRRRPLRRRDPGPVPRHRGPDMPSAGQHGHPDHHRRARRSPSWPDHTVTKTVACRTGTAERGTQCLREDHVPQGHKLSRNTARRSSASGHLLRGSTCVKTKAKARAKKSSATSIRTR